MVFCCRCSHLTGLGTIEDTVEMRSEIRVQSTQGSRGDWTALYPAERARTTCRLQAQPYEKRQAGRCASALLTKMRLIKRIGRGGQGYFRRQIWNHAQSEEHEREHRPLGTNTRLENPVRFGVPSPKPLPHFTSATPVATVPLRHC